MKERLYKYFYFVQLFTKKLWVCDATGATSADGRDREDSWQNKYMGDIIHVLDIDTT